MCVLYLYFLAFKKNIFFIAPSVNIIARDRNFSTLSQVLQKDTTSWWISVHLAVNSSHLLCSLLFGSRGIFILQARLCLCTTPLRTQTTPTEVAAPRSAFQSAKFLNILTSTRILLYPGSWSFASRLACLLRASTLVWTPQNTWREISR